MDLSGKLVLITGSSGFIGSHVCQKLLKSGAHVRAFVRKGGAVGFSCHKNLEYSTGDLLDSKSLERLAKMLTRSCILVVSHIQTLGMMKY